MKTAPESRGGGVADLAPDALFGSDAPFATRIVLSAIDTDGRFSLELSRDGVVIAFAMVDAALADRLASECARMAVRCRAALNRSPGPDAGAGT